MNNASEMKYLNLDYVFRKFLQFFGAVKSGFLKLLAWLGASGLKMFLISLSVVLLVGIIFLLYKIFRLKKDKIAHLVDFIPKEEPRELRSAKWDAIKKKIDSDISSEWKMAIIEADSIIDEIFKTIGFGPETLDGRPVSLGDRLKAVEPSDFDNLQGVWEAHKVRNRIVHGGDKFEITKEEAKEALEKYEKALKELKYM
ncbi:MAG: hypothetical protein WC587_02640 [Candidatus Paceibacterota bacterium]